MPTDSDFVSLMKTSKVSPFRTCQWPFGEPGTEEFRYCGEKTFESFSYCAEHVKMAYREPENRRDRSADHRRSAA